MRLPSPPKPVHREQIRRGSTTYWLNIMPAGYMRKVQLRGFAKNGEAYISEELTRNVRRFVINHEIYHLNDKHRWLGYFGKELRANIICGLKDPSGLLATTISVMKSGGLLRYFKALLGDSYYKG